VMSLIVVIYRASNPHMAVLARIPGTKYFRNIARFEHLEERNDLLIVRVDGPIYFANLNYIKKKMDKWMLESPLVKHIIFNFEGIPSVDSSGAHELEDWIKEWKGKGLTVSISGAKGPVEDTLNTWRITDEIGQENMFPDDASAVDYIDAQLSSEKK